MMARLQTGEVQLENGFVGCFQTFPAWKAQGRRGATGAVQFLFPANLNPSGPLETLISTKSIELLVLEDERIWLCKGHFN